MWPHASGLPCALAVSQAQPDRVFVAISGYGIYALDTAQAPADGQDAPARTISTGLATPYFAGSGALLLVPGNPETLYAATLEGGIWRTRDGGTTWESLPATRGFVFALAVDPGDPKHFLAAAARKTVLETRDVGATWTSHPLPGARPDHGHRASGRADRSVLYLADLALAAPPGRPGRTRHQPLGRAPVRSAGGHGGRGGLRQLGKRDQPALPGPWG